MNDGKDSNYARTVRLVGGWGHDNLGDEAILAGYVSYLSKRFEIEIRTSSPAATTAALGIGVPSRSVNVVSEKSVSRPIGMPTILCGGGYLNGSWKAKFEEKTLRLIALRPYSKPLIVHSVELQNLQNSFQRRLARSTIGTSFLSARDVGSKTRMESLGAQDVRVMPDAISLLYPAVSRYLSRIPGLEDKLLVNLLDIAGRPDAGEGELDVPSWDDFVSDLAKNYRGNIIGLDAGAFDTEYMRKFGLPVIKTRTVRGLVSALGSARSVLSTRMHPALIATQLGTPTASVPYCAKVRPTLTRLGMQEIILTDLSLSALRDGISSEHKFSKEWGRAYIESTEWLESCMERG